MNIVGLLDRPDAGSYRFEGEDVCGGMVGNVACARVLGYVATATYHT